MRNKKKKFIPSLLTKKIMEDVKTKKIDFIIDLIIAGITFYIIHSIVTGLWVLLKIRY